MSEARASTRRRRWPLFVLAGFLVLVIAIVAIYVLPILLHRDQGLSGQEAPTAEWPTQVTATGDDGLTRELLVVSADPGATVDTSALAHGDRIVVSGTGYDASRGIYVAVCAIPESAAVKPGPCLGGMPDQEAVEVADGTIQFAPSNWINDDWAWKLFGARGFDDAASGTFTAYLEVGDPTTSALDCTEVACAIFTRNDHTASNDRVQDVYIPVAFE